MGAAGRRRSGGERRGGLGLRADPPEHPGSAALSTPDFQPGLRHRHPGTPAHIGGGAEPVRRRCGALPRRAAGGHPNRHRGGAVLAQIAHPHQPDDAHLDRGRASGRHQTDLIIDTGADEQTYTALAAIAPTLTRPADPAAAWGPAAQLAWIGRALGTTDAASSLQKQAAVDQASIRQQNPLFAGKSVAVASFSDTGLSALLSQSAAATYLSGLGFTYPSALTSTAATQVDKPVQADSLAALTLNNLLVVIRTDSAAAGGGVNGLPPELINGGANLLVVDDPDTVSALSSGGPAATSYLNTTWVDSLAAKLR